MSAGENIRNGTKDSAFPCKIKRTANGSQFKKDSSPANNGSCVRREDKSGSSLLTEIKRISQEPSCRENHDMQDMQASSRTSIKECIQKSISEESKRKIVLILNEVLQLSDVEKLLLYLQLPTGANAEVDPLKLKVPGNPLGKKADAEVAQTYTWIQSHLEEDHEVSLPKQEVYDEYKLFCDDNKIEPLCAADFGKVMKHIFPSVKPRRLGTRGNSRYCYSGLRKKLVVESPALPNLDISGEALQTKSNQDGEVISAASHLIFEWAEKLLGKRFSTLRELSCHLVENLYVDTRSVAAFTILSSSHHPSSKGHNAASLLKNAGGNRRRETQLHLQRKLQEKELIKEQKKKLFEQRSLLSSRKNSLTSSRSKTSKAKDESSAASVVPKQHQEENEHTQQQPKTLPVQQEEKVKRCSSAELARRAKKVPIPRNSSAVHFPQASFIILPSIQPSVTLGSPTKPSPSQQKYKRIQPKPSHSPGPSSSLSVRDDAASSIRAFAVESSDGERSERSSPLQSTLHQSLDLCHSDSEQLRTFKDSPPIETESDGMHNILLSSKRPSDESCDPCAVTSKRPHFDNQANSGNTTSSGSLSPWSQSRTEQSACDVALQPVIKEEVSIRQLETDALLEYLQDGTCDPSLEKIATTTTSSVASNTAQLSQLRLLLERNLPQRAIKSSTTQVMGSVEEGDRSYSEIRQALLRDNRTCFRSKSEAEKSSVVLSWNDTNFGEGGGGLMLKDVPHLEAIEACSQFNEYESGGVVIDDADNLQLLDGVISDSGGANDSMVISSSNVNQEPFIDGGNFLINFQHQNEATRSSAYTQIPSVPPSPNTRRRAFNFLPISPRQTPVPDNLGYAAASPGPQQMCNANSLASSLVSIAVGPSQPPSTATSPFVSPRSTPVPVSRSRHNSGQSAYSTPRQTPCQNFDSGVSSISTSPFVSPQSTPVPLSRLRHNSSHSQGKTVTFCTTQSFARPRRNSGPGGPPLISSQFASPRSAPLSPLVGECYTQTSAFSFPAVGETPPLRSRHSSASTTPMSPMSGPVSPKQSEIEDTTEEQSKLWTSMCKLPSVAFLKGGAAWPQRSRHVSGSVINRPVTHSSSDPLSCEIQNYLQQDIPTSSRANRSRSVPLHQMLRTLMDQCSDPRSDGFVPAANCKFPPLSEAARDNWNPRRNLNELLEQPPPLEDDLQTTLEDLRDVDNDFSKLAQELEQMDRNGEFA